MNITASFLILIAVILSVLVFIALIGWWRGADNVLFPGFGVIVAMPALIVLLLILNAAFVVFAAYLKPKRNIADEIKTEQPLEYQNDIFGGCGNGVLDISLAKNPDKYDAKTDRALKVCINFEDLSAIQDVVVSGRIDFQNLQHNEEYEKAGENNQQVFQKFASVYPLLGRLDDMYQDYVFTPEEIPKLRQECLKIQAVKQDAAADLA